MHLIKKVTVVFLCFFVSNGFFVHLAWATPTPDVLKTERSVFLVWTVTSYDNFAKEFLNKTISQQEKNNMKAQIDASKGYYILTIRGEKLPIFVRNNELYVSLGNGSSFLVSDDGHFVTNRHVIERHLSGKDKILLVKDVNPLQFISVDIVSHNAAKDLAILKASSPVNENPLTLYNADESYKGKSTIALGFPAGADQIIGDRVNIERTVTDGIYSAFQKDVKWSYSGGVVDLIQHNADINKGNSGGPLLNTCHQVIGVNVGAPKINTAKDIQRAAGVLYAVSVPELIEELKKENIDYSVTDTVCVPESLNAKTGYLWFLLLAAIVLAIAGFIYLKSRVNQVLRDIAAGKIQKSPSRLINTLVKTKVEIEGKKDAQGYVWKQDDEGRYLRFGDEGLIYWQGPPASPYDVKVDTGNKITLNSLTGQQDIGISEGETIYVGNNPNKKPQLKLAGDHISQNHLSLYFDGKQLWVEDLGSMNGSYIDGKQIQTKTKFQVGQKLAIGDESVLYALVAPSDDPLPKKAVAKLLPLEQGLSEVTLHANQSLSIGYTASCDITIDSSHMSSIHARIKVNNDGAIVLEDAHSTNGTFVDSMDNRITEVELKHGQKICFADPSIAYKFVVL